MPKENMTKNPQQYTKSNHRLLMAGYFGAGNVGDEAILLAQTRSLSRSFELHVLSFNPVVTASSYDTKSSKLPSLCSPRQLLQYLRLVQWCDALVVGGGGFLANKLQPFSVYYWLLLMSIARIFRKKVILFSVGCGPFKTGIHSALIRAALNKADLLLLRDSMSGSLLKNGNAISTKTKVTADMAFLLGHIHLKLDNSLAESIQGRKTPKTLFVLCPRFHSHKLWKSNKAEKKYQLYVASMAEIADFVVIKLGGTPIFLPFYPDDTKFYYDILEKMTFGDKVVLLKHSQNIDAVLTLFKNVDVVVGARYHSIVFSILSGKPVVPIIYHHKSYALARKINAPSLQIGANIEWPDININVAKAKQYLTEICENTGKRIPWLQVKRKELEQLALENVSVIEAFFLENKRES
jgi:polysaccharide pyruvyl transferase CsaB